MEEENFIQELQEFVNFTWYYFNKRTYKVFRHFEFLKSLIVDNLYRKRGKYTQPFIHSGMVGLAFAAVTFGPLILSEQAKADVLAQGTLPTAVVLGVSTDPNYLQQITTSSSQGVIEYRGGEVVDYEVREGDTVGSIAEKFNLQVTTILWANDLTDKSKIKPGQTLKIPPVDGVVHTVKKGDTIYSIAKKYSLEDEAGAQGIVNYPFNTFTDDETFGLAIGQTLMVPDGVMPEEKPTVGRPTVARILTPDAGSVSATGQFVWPTSGTISQGFRWYHQGIDISNRAGGAILAADSGRIIVAGWPDNYGYGNRIMIDHGNGYVTLYAHLSRIRVSVGQSVNRGDVIGDMGSTGRSTGIHLHFEIRQGGVLQSPLNFLK